MCDYCNQVRVNGHVVHEAGCPLQERKCWNCDSLFSSLNQQQTLCENCFEELNGEYMEPYEFEDEEDGEDEEGEE